jgi:hypothetical protein
MSFNHTDLTAKNTRRPNLRMQKKPERKRKNPFKFNRSKGYQCPKSYFIN